MTGILSRPLVVFVYLFGTQSSLKMYFLKMQALEMD